MRQLVVRIPSQQQTKLSLLAAAKNKTVSQITRSALSEFLSKNTPKTSKNWVNRLAHIANQGRNIKSPPHLSTSKFDYLYGKKSPKFKKYSP